jgi:hypothetical protein
MWTEFCQSSCNVRFMAVVVSGLAGGGGGGGGAIGGAGPNGHKKGGKK